MAVTAVYSTLGLVLASQLASAQSIPPIVQPPYPSSGIPHKGFGHITDLVAFGDSYTDEGRLGYLFGHNGDLPPLGWRPPENDDASTGGKVWARMVAEQTGVNLENYAVAGGACNNDITPRVFTTWMIPDVQHYEVGTYIDEHFGPGSFFPFNADSTIFGLWIGTNDLGPGDFMTDSSTPGTNLGNYTDCLIQWIDRLYDVGGRNFVLMSLANLQHAPQFATAEHGGSIGPNNHYWPTKGDWMDGNLTAISNKMREMVLTSNNAVQYKLAYAALRLKDANIAYFDAYGIMEDIWNNPQNYLEAPYNITGFVSHCYDDCTQNYLIDNGTTENSFMWYDEVHPTQMTSSIIADEFSKTINGTSNYATYYF